MTKGLPREEYEEMMNIGADIVAEVKRDLKATSFALQTNFRHGVRTMQGVGTGSMHTASIVLLFTVTDLCGSNEEVVRQFIKDELTEIFCKPAMMRYRTEWKFEVVK